MPTMPNLIGLQYQNALAALVKAGARVVPLGYFQVDPITTSWIKALASQPGYVLGQSIAPGQAMVANAPVTLTVSSYPMGVSGDGPVTSQNDALDDQSGSAFILNESKLK